MNKWDGCSEKMQSEEGEESWHVEVNMNIKLVNESMLKYGMWFCGLKYPQIPMNKMSARVTSITIATQPVSSYN